MASGPEHYREAEEYLAAARKFYAKDRYEDGQLAAALAQVHATLALTAATAEVDAIEVHDGDYHTGRTDEEGKAWRAVLLDAPAVAYDPEDKNAPKDGA